VVGVVSKCTIEREASASLGGSPSPSALATLKSMVTNDLVVELAACAATPGTKLLAAHGAPINAAQADGATPLHLAAASQSSFVLVKTLLALGANVAAARTDGRTPLHLVCAYSGTGFLSIARELLARGAPVNAADNAGATPLFAASAAGDSEVVKLLLKQGAAAEAATHAGSTPLIVASEKGYLETVRLLLARGPSPSVLARALAGARGPAVFRLLKGG
jgi:ankyrin repeat protein